METRAAGEERTVELAVIKVDAELQMRFFMHAGVRAAVDDDIVAEYQEALDAGSDLGRLALLAEQDEQGHGTGRLLLVDGFHRLAAMRRLGRAAVDVVVYEGTRADGVLLACELNAKRGLSYRPSDKQQVARNYLEALAAKGLNLADTEVAHRLGFSRSTISRAREDLARIGVAFGPRVVTRGSTTYVMKTRRPANDPDEWQERLQTGVRDDLLDVETERASRVAPQAPLPRERSPLPPPLVPRPAPISPPAASTNRPEPTAARSRGQHAVTVALHLRWSATSVTGEVTGGSVDRSQLKDLPVAVKAVILEELGVDASILDSRGG
jgi:hypothetical protein